MSAGLPLVEKGLMDSPANDLPLHLPSLAITLSGWVLYADGSGIARHIVDPLGSGVPEHEGESLFSVSPEAPEEAVCPWNANVRFRILPFGDGYLCLDVDGTERRVRERFEQALPLIAQVAGGEAVLFNQEGMRLASVDSEGNSTASYVGRVSALARESMESGKPIIGESTYIVGAKAVRVPLTDSLGFGFNNNDSVAQRQKLIDNIYEFQSAETVFQDIIGGPVEVERAIRKAKDAAEADGPTLIVGGKGTGKRMYAQAMHNAGLRRSRSFVTVNCASLDQELLEGALFGYADAVIRGVMRGRYPGAMVMAEGGTLYLMNVDQMNANLQVKLAAAMRDWKFYPVGDDTPVKLTVRVVASMDKSPESMMKVGRLDKELYRLFSKDVVTLPALASIPEIIPDLVNAFVGQLNLQSGKHVESADNEVLEILEEQPWPGNAQELKAFLRTVLAGMDNESTIIKKRHLPMRLLGKATANGDSEDDTVYGMLVRDYEAQIINHALQVNGGSRQKTADHLGLSKSSLWRKMKKLGID